MIKLTQSALLARRAGEGKRPFVFVEFNAWLYQGYDDARAALMDVIATKVEAEAKARNTVLDKVASLIKRVRWLRVTSWWVERRLPSRPDCRPSCCSVNSAALDNAPSAASTRH